MVLKDEEPAHDDLKPEEVVQSLPARKVRRMSVTRVADKNDLRRPSVGYSDVSSIREILTDITFSTSHIIHDKRLGITNSSEENKRREDQEKKHQQMNLKRMDTLKRAQSRSESRKGRIESISMMMGDSPLDTPSRVHRRSMRGSFQRIDRSNEAAADLYELMKETEFFKQLPRKAGIEVCRHISYKDVPKGGLLFREGEIGLSVYFILSGSVKVYIPESSTPATPQKIKKRVVKRRKKQKSKKLETGENNEVAEEDKISSVGEDENEELGSLDLISINDPSVESHVPEPDLLSPSRPGSSGNTSRPRRRGAVSMFRKSTRNESSENLSEKDKEGSEGGEATTSAKSKDGQEGQEEEAPAATTLNPVEEKGGKEADKARDNDSRSSLTTTTGEKSAETSDIEEIGSKTGGDNSDDESDSEEEYSEWVSEEEPEDYGRLIVELFSPSMFGELALIRESPRTATVVCEPNTELMELERHDFDRILRRMGNVVFMPERLKEILSVPPKQRADHENLMALDLLGRHKFLQNLDKDIAKQLMGKLTLSVVQENELIFKQGEVGSQFYIILTGKVHIFIDRRAKKEETEEQNKEEAQAGDDEEGNKKEKGKKGKKHKQDSKRHAKDKSNQSSPDKDSSGKGGEGKEEVGVHQGGMKQGFEQSAIVSETIFSGRGDRMVAPEDWEEVLGSKKQTLSGGDSFGDRALLQKNTLRTGSAIAAEKTEIMVLSQADFKRLFSQDRNEVEGFERVAELLQIDSGARSKDQLDELAQLLTKTSSFFQTLEPELHYDICQAASYKRLQSNDVVFVQGEVGDAFYVVLRGTLSLHIKGTPGLPPPKKEPKEPEVGEDGEVFDEPEDLTEIYGPCISVLSGGQSFGELALLHGMPRTGTVLCQDESELLVLWKADYDEILQTSQARELERQVAFLRNLPNLDQLSTGRLMRIAYCFQLKELSRGYTLLQQGKTAEKGQVYVYIVKEGAIKMVRKTNMKKLAGAFHASVAPSARLSILSNNLGLSPRAKQQGKTLTSKNSLNSSKEDALGLPQETEICVLGPGEICGDIAAFLDVPQPVSVTAVCDTVLHAVKLEDLVRSVSDEVILEEFRHTSRNRLKWILERESRITSTWTSYLMQAQELRMTKNDSPRSQKKKARSKRENGLDKARTPKKGGQRSSSGSTVVASPGMTKTSVVFQSRSLVERAEEAIKSLVLGTKQMDSKMWDTMKGMDVSMTKHYWSPSKQKQKEEMERKGGRKLSLPQINTPTKVNSQSSTERSLVQILSSKSSMYLSSGQTMSPMKIPPIGTPSRFRYKRSPFNSRIVKRTDLQH